MSTPLTLVQLRRYAVTRSLFEPTTLAQAIDRLGFVQADPIRAPARAQDLTLRHRVRGYRAGDLDRAYAELGVEEDYFVVYGFLPRSIQALMHPRARSGVPIGTGRPWSAVRRRRAQALLSASWVNVLARTTITTPCDSRPRIRASEYSIIGGVST